MHLRTFSFVILGVGIVKSSSRRSWKCSPAGRSPAGALFARTGGQAGEDDVCGGFSNPAFIVDECNGYGFFTHKRSLYCISDEDIS